MTDHQDPTRPLETSERDQSRRMARRFFVKAAIYAAPTVASVVSVQHASAQTSFCTNTCGTAEACTNEPLCIACTPPDGNCL